MRWHALAPDDVLRSLETSDDGLSATEAGLRLGRVGPNTLPAAPKPSALALLVRQLTSPLLYALLGSAAVAMALGEVEDGVVVLAVVVLNALIGFVSTPTWSARRTRGLPRCRSRPGVA